MFPQSCFGLTWSSGCGTGTTGSGPWRCDDHTGFAGHLWRIRMLEWAPGSADSGGVRLEWGTWSHRGTAHTFRFTRTGTSLRASTTNTKIVHRQRGACGTQTACWLWDAARTRIRRFRLLTLLLLVLQGQHKARSHTGDGWCLHLRSFLTRRRRRRWCAIAQLALSARWIFILFHNHIVLARRHFTRWQILWRWFSNRTGPRWTGLWITSD